jgi:predicted transcriptional regulator
MARISKYDNPNSLQSKGVIQNIVKETHNFTIEDLDKFQSKYGISNKDLSELTGHSQTQITDFKDGTNPLSTRVKQHLFLIIKHFETQFDSITT